MTTAQELINLFFILIPILLLLVLIFIVIDYFTVKLWTERTKKSINDIFDKAMKLSIVVYLLNLLGIGGNDEPKNEG